MINILYVLDSINYNSGVSAVVMSYIREINKEKFKIDLVVHKPCNQELISELEEMGCTVFHLPDITLKSFSAYRKAFSCVLKNKKYTIVHGHISNATFLYMKEAKKQKIKHRIIHAHSTKSSSHFFRKIRNNVLEKNIYKWANHFFACSPLAATHLLKKHSEDVEVLPNSIDVERFSYKPNMRKQVRKQWGITKNTIVVGHVGRLDKEKNHQFLIDVFSCYHKKNPNSKLILAGDGPLLGKLKNKVADLHLQNEVVFLGVLKNIEIAYHAFDIFLLPSNLEGFGIVGVEAQCSGLPCVFSNNVPNYIKITDHTTFLSIKDRQDVQLWAETVHTMLSSFTRKDNSRLLKESYFNINNLIDHLEILYSKMQ